MKEYPTEEQLAEHVKRHLDNNQQLIDELNKYFGSQDEPMQSCLRQQREKIHRVLGGKL